MAFLLVPMRSLGGDGWKIAAALMGRHIGGGIVDCFLDMMLIACISNIFPI